METVQKICKRHGLTEFSVDKNGKCRCKKCRQDAVQKRRRNLKQLAVEYKGGKCQICGYNKYIGALEFHHLNPEEKDFEIGCGNTKSFEKFKKELDKCILVCSNCHKELHGKEYKHEDNKLDYKDAFENREKYGITNIPNSYKHLIETDILNDMQNDMSRKDIFKKYHINNKTFNMFLREYNLTYHEKKVSKKPTEEELKNLLAIKTKTEIGKMYGVTEAAVRKWCKKLIK